MLKLTPLFLLLNLVSCAKNAPANLLLQDDELLLVLPDLIDKIQKQYLPEIFACTNGEESILVDDQYAFFSIEAVSSEVKHELINKFGYNEMDELLVNDTYFQKKNESFQKNSIEGNGDCLLKLSVSGMSKKYFFIYVKELNNDSVEATYVIFRKNNGTLSIKESVVYFN